MFQSLSPQKPRRSRQAGAALLAAVTPAWGLLVVALVSQQVVTEVPGQVAVDVDFPVQEFSGGAPPGPPAPAPAPAPAAEDPPPQVEDDTPDEPDESDVVEDPQESTDAVASLDISNGALDGTGKEPGPGGGGGGTCQGADCDGAGPGDGPGPGSGPMHVHHTQVKVLRKAEPRMPNAARGLPGDHACTIRFFLAETGDVTDIQVIDCPEVFVDNTLRAAWKWRFAPVTDTSGTPRSATFTLAVTYRVN